MAYTMHQVHIPKTAGTSIAYTLGTEELSLRASQVERPRFTFVRHPLDRLVSMWAFIKIQPHDSILKGNVTADTTFDEFVRMDLKNDLTYPQMCWLDAPVDFIGRFERLEYDFAKLSD